MTDSVHINWSRKSQPEAVTLHRLKLTFPENICKVNASDRLFSFVFALTSGLMVKNFFVEQICTLAGPQLK
jgi:hypothetical protein